MPSSLASEYEAQDNGAARAGFPAEAVLREAERFRAIGGQIPVHGAIQRADAGAAVHDKTAVAFRVDVAMHHVRRVGGEFADDFLEDIFATGIPLGICTIE